MNRPILKKKPVLLVKSAFSVFFASIQISGLGFQI
jgi:hypothetical protein